MVGHVSKHWRFGKQRRASAMMTAMFVMAVTSIIVIGILDTETLEYSALRNTIQYDRARYLAEAGAAHALAFLEDDITWRQGIPATEFPAGSGDTYWATVTDGPDATVLVTAVGTAGSVTRSVEVRVKQGG
jgi:hypothetical protein